MSDRIPTRSQHITSLPVSHPSQARSDSPPSLGAASAAPRASSWADTWRFRATAIIAILCLVLAAGIAGGLD